MQQSTSVIAYITNEHPQRNWLFSLFEFGAFAYTYMRTSYRILMSIAAFMLMGEVRGQLEVPWVEVKLDSLEKVNAAHPKQDLAKLTILNQLTYHYANVDPAKGVKTGEQAIALGQKLNKPLLVAEAYHNKGLNHVSLGEPDLAIELNEQALAILEGMNNKPEVAHYTCHLGDLFMQKGDNEKASELFEKALHIFEVLGNNSGMARAYNAIGVIHSYQSHYPLALQYLQKALDFNNQLGDKNGSALNLRRMGNVYYGISEYQKALEFYQKALDLSEETGDTDAIAKNLSNFGTVYNDLSDFPRSLEYYQQALDMFLRLGDKNLIVFGLRNMGHVYVNMNDYQKALEFYQKALIINEQVGNKKDLATTLGNIGNAYIELADYTNALEFCQKALTLNEQFGNKGDVANDLWNMGKVYQRLPDYVKALEYMGKALEITEDLGSRNPAYLNGIGGVYYALCDYPQALAYYQQALHLQEQIKDKSGIADNLAGIGNIYRDAPATDLHKLGIKPADRFTLALQYQNQSLKLAKEIGELGKERDIWWNLKLTYEKQKDFPKAYEAYKNYIILRDSIQGEETKKQFTRKEIQYEFDKKESELKLQQQLTDEQLQRQQLLHKRQRWMYLSAVLAFLGVASLLAMRLRYARRKQQLLEQQKEMEIREAERLKELDRLKTMLYTNITHEFRTPLTIISGVAAELKSNSDTFASGVETIQRNSARLLNLVNQMLDLSKLQSGMLSAKFVNGDIVQYAGYIVQSFQSLAASRGITLHFLPEMVAFPMDYDAEKTMQILSNLISNSIKFTPAGGNVYLHLATVQSNNLEHLQIKVQDTGIGISQEHLAHVFDRFYQVKQTYRADKGTGIGLALTKELVHFLGGTINVQSKPGKGSVFVVTLPVSQEAVDEAIEYLPESVHDVVASFGPAHNGETVVQGNGVDLKEIPRLLIIEDTLDVISYLKMCLSNDYRITEAHDGGEGIQTAIDTIPDIIITDVMMPVKDGYQVCKTLKEDERTSHIPIIMLTARADTHSKLTGLETGADAYLYKPFEKEELQIRLRKLLELRATLQKRYTNGKPVELVGDRNMEREDHFISKLKEIIYAHLDDEDFGIVQLCKAMHLSRSQLHNKLKALTGRSTSLYVRLIRLQKAKELLKDPEMHISEVAYATGFKDPAYFTRCFVEDFGMNPSEFRNAVAGNR